jgi:hypothetical protein
MIKILDHEFMMSYDLRRQMEEPCRQGNFQQNHDAWSSEI